jgi:hypothetical protein
MEMVEELCESVVLIDRGKVVLGGSVREVRRSTGRQVIRLAVDDDTELAWLADVPGVRVVRPGQDFAELDVDQSVDPETVLRAALDRGKRVTQFLIADPSIEDIFIEKVGRRPVEEQHLVGAATGATPGRPERRRDDRPRNVFAIARREYLARARTRTFKLTTVVLVIAGVGVALAPVLFRAVFGEGKQTRIEVVVGTSNPGVEVAPTLAAILNAPLIPIGGSGGSGSTSDTPQFEVATVTDETAARTRVLDGDSEGLLVVARPTSDGDLTFEFVTNATQFDRLPQVVRQAATQIAIQDRLINAGIPLGQQGQLFAPPTYAITPADPNAAPGKNPEDLAGGFAAGFVLAIVLFMAIVLYGQWIAYSVVEEKSSRVMEVILGAATPFELLSGKVAGVGALALTQYLIVFVAGRRRCPVPGPDRGPHPRRFIGAGRPASRAVRPAPARVRRLLRLRFRVVRSPLRWRRLAREPHRGHQPDRRPDDPHLDGRLPGRGLLLDRHARRQLHVRRRHVLHPVLQPVPDAVPPGCRPGRACRGHRALVLLAVSVPLALWVAARLLRRRRPDVRPAPLAASDAPRAPRRPISAPGTRLEPSCGPGLTGDDVAARGWRRT